MLAPSLAPPDLSCVLLVAVEHSWVWTGGPEQQQGGQENTTGTCPAASLALALNQQPAWFRIARSDSRAFECPFRDTPKTLKLGGKAEVKNEEKKSKNSVESKMKFVRLTFISNSPNSSVPHYLVCLCSRGFASMLALPWWTQACRCS